VVIHLGIFYPGGSGDTSFGLGPITSQIVPYLNYFQSYVHIVEIHVRIPPANETSSDRRELHTSTSRGMTTTTAILVLLLVDCDVFAFAPGPQQLQSRRPSVVRRSATINDDENALPIEDGWGKASGGAFAAFLMGMGIMAQLAFADTTAITVIDAGEF